MNISKATLRVACGIILASLLAVAYGPKKSIAADLQVAPSGRCDIKVSGEIVEGDAERISKALEVREEKEVVMTALCLNSEGGNYAEALNIINMILERGGVLATIVEKGDQCLSACALIFLAGQKHLGDGAFVPFRFMSVGAKIGFHAPYITAEGSPKGATAARIYREAIIAIGRLLTLTADDKQREDFFPRSLLAEALKVGSDDFFLMDQVDKLGRWNIILFDHAKPERITNRMLTTACQNADKWQLWGRFAQGEDYSVDHEGKPLPKEAPLKFVKRKYKATLKWYGFEYKDVCNVMVYDHPNFGPILTLSFNNAVSDAEDLINIHVDRKWQADDLDLVAIGVPLYFMLPASTSLSNLSSVIQPPSGQADVTTRILRWVEQEYLDDQVTYAARVDWYDKGVISRDAVLQDRAKYIAAWPERKFTLVPGTLQIANAGPNRYTATFSLSYWVRNARGEERSGRSHLTVDLVASGSQLMLARQNEVVHRQR